MGAPIGISEVPNKTNEIPSEAGRPAWWSAKGLLFVTISTQGGEAIENDVPSDRDQSCLEVLLSASSSPPCIHSMFPTTTDANPSTGVGPPIATAAGATVKKNRTSARGSCPEERARPIR